MHAHPDIAALRTDREPQRRAQAAMEGALQAWRAHSATAPLVADIERYGAGDDLETCARLQAVFGDCRVAGELVDALVGEFTKALRANPYGHPPFRNGFDGHSSSLLLARSGRAQLLLQAREPGYNPADGYIYTDAERHDCVLGGDAEGRIVTLGEHPGGEARFAERAVRLTAGVRLTLDLSTEALLVENVARRLVVLRLVRAPDNPRPVRQFEAATGRLRQTSAGQIATSRQEAIVTLLGRLGRTDAAPEFVRIALREGEQSLRWLALRECLALDTAAGFAALSDLARRDADPLAAHAGALRAQLLEAHPQLAILEGQSCPA